MSNSVEYYEIPEDPEYNAIIRKIQNNDPVNADAVLNPVLQQLIENIASLYKQIRGVETKGSANAYTFTPETPITAYAVGQKFRIRFHADNTSTTVNVNNSGLGNRRVYTVGTTGPAVGLIKKDSVWDLVDNGTAYLLREVDVADIPPRNGTGYGTCSTAAATVAKTVAQPGFQRFTGSIVGVNFTTGNTATNPTLNYASTGAAALRANGEPLGELVPGEYWFMFNGSVWSLLSNIASGSAGGSVVALYSNRGTHQWTVPETRRYRVTVIGGGGGGAATHNATGQNLSGGGGGGSGNPPIELNLTQGQVIPITVGAGGRPGTSANTASASQNGEDGGTSSFGTFLSTPGGQGGRRNSGGQALGGGIGGKGASGSPASSPNAGGGGGAGTILWQPTNDAAGTTGGVGILLGGVGGSGGTGGVSGTNEGTAGMYPGGGGGGGRAVPGSQIGGSNGADGIVIIERGA